MVEDKVVEVEKKLQEKIVENEVLKEQVKKLIEEVQKFFGEGGVDGVKDKLSKLVCGLDDVEDGGEEKLFVEVVVDVFIKKVLFFF